MQPITPATLDDLIAWTHTACNGDWEHGYGVSIHMVDNPGWAVSIDVLDLDVDLTDPSHSDHNRGENDWMICRWEGRVFKGDGDLNKLPLILGIFLASVSPVR